MIKAVFFDLDGTLLSHESGHVPPSTLAALAQLKAQGIRVLLATGRHIIEIRRLLPGLSFDGYVTINGQICLDENQNLLCSHPIRREDVERILLPYEKHQVPIMLVEEEQSYVNFINGYVEQAHRDISTPLPELGRYTGNPLYQIVIYDEGPQADRLFGQLEHCQMTRWNRYGVDIVGASGGKAVGIRFFLERLGLQRQEVMAFGDGENDMDMLSFAGIGVAMGNSGDPVKACADYITDHIDADGVQKALRHFGVI